MAVLCVASVATLVVALGFAGVLGAPRPAPEDHEMDVLGDGTPAVSLDQRDLHCNFKVSRLQEPDGVDHVECTNDSSCVQLTSYWWKDGEKQPFHSGCAHLTEGARPLDHEAPVTEWRDRRDTHCPFRVAVTQDKGVKIEEVICGSECQQVTSDVMVNGERKTFMSGCVYRGT